MTGNSKARSLELRTLAAEILAASGVDVTQAVDRGQMRKMIDELVRRGNCHPETARQQIARAIRRARDPNNNQSAWGGSRPGAGRLPMNYTAWASNDQGASTNVANGETFTSKAAAAAAARAELGAGWKVHIVDSFGDEVQTFTIRK